MYTFTSRNCSLHLQQSHEASNKAQAQHSISSDLASAIDRHLADSGRRRRSCRGLVLGSSRGLRGDGGGDDDGGAVGRVSGGDLKHSAVLRVDDAGGAVLPKGDGDEGLRASHVERLRGGDLCRRCGFGARAGCNSAAVSRCAGENDCGRDVVGRGLVDGSGVDLRHGGHGGGARASTGNLEGDGRAGGRGDHEEAANAGGGVGEVHGEVTSVVDRGCGGCQSVVSKAFDCAVRGSGEGRGFGYFIGGGTVGAKNARCWRRKQDKQCSLSL